MSETKWIRRWRYEIAPKPTKPGVWRKKGGGFLVRGKATDPTTGKRREVLAPFTGNDAAAAYSWLHQELRKIRLADTAGAASQIRFSDYATSLLERKIIEGDIQSAKTRLHWGYVLEHHLFPVFGNYWMDKLPRQRILEWKLEVGRLIHRGDYSPQTANGWLAVFRVIVNTFVADAQLDRNPIINIENFDTSGCDTYTEESPNALQPATVAVFLAAMRSMFPQHFAMVALGFALGLRPSSLRPLRRKGPDADIDWETGELRIRRSHTVKQEVMKKTKTGVRQRIALPEELVDILKWHSENLPEGPMRDADLLFPSDTGSFRSTTVLDKPFKAVAAAAGIKFKFTPRGMRRTFQDLARAAQVKDIVTRRISGHLTEEMHEHYSTVWAEEVREGLGRVVSLAKFREAMAAPPTNDTSRVGVKVGVKRPKSRRAG